MDTKDKRMTETSEALNNVKMLKLYSWQNKFYERIAKRRANEVVAIRKMGVAIAILIAGIYLFPSLLPAVVFSTYIGTGHYIDLGTGVMCLLLFNSMREPLISLPMFLADFIDLQVSMKRITKFIKLDEVQTNICEQVLSENAIDIKGSFSWGFKKKKEDEEKSDNKKDDDKAKKSKKKSNRNDKVEETKEEDYKQLKQFMTLKNLDLKI